MTQEVKNDKRLKVDATKIEEKTSKIVVQADGITITKTEDFAPAAEFLKGLKSIQKEINATFDPIAKKLHAAHKETVAQKNKHLEPIQNAEQIVKRKISSYQTEVEEKRRAEERRLQEIARKREEDARLAEAAALEQEGKKDEAEALIEEEVVAPVVVLKSEAPKVSGITTRQVWKFRIKDEAKIPREYMIPDTKKIGAVARAMKDAAKIPGVEVYSEGSVAAGSM